jgi:hypothetical protein
MLNFEGKMKTFLKISLLLLASSQAASKGQMLEPLKFVATIALPGLNDGDFDHFAVDLAGNRLFVAAEENSVVEVVDLRTNQLLHTIKGPKAPHSLAYASDVKKLFVVDDGGPNQVEIYDGTSFDLVGTIPMKAHADASIYDPTEHLFYVGNGGKAALEDYCLISIIDTTNLKKIGDIRVESDRVEAMALEKSGPRLFVNLYSKGSVAVIDRRKREVIGTWSIAPEGTNNGPMAFDEQDHRLFVLARQPGKVIVLDSASGKIVAALWCIGDYDDAIYDTKYRRLYLVGDPFIRIFQKTEGRDRYDNLGQIPTAFHAETGILVPELNRLYVAVNHHGETDAVIQVFEVVP